MRESEKFEQWYKGIFICTRSPASPLLVSDNKGSEAKSLRILEVCKRIINEPKKSTEELREEVAMDFLISMRVALDYLSYARLILKRWEQFKQTQS